MPISKLLILLSFLAASACAATGVETSASHIYVMRHLNTPAGERDPDLLPGGHQAAERLADQLSGSGIRAIYVTDYKRTRQTAAPLAARLRIEPILYEPADSPALASRVKSGPLPALIVGHSNTVPDIVSALGGERPSALTHEDFGSVWRVGPGGATLRTELPASR